jgi:hydrogenase maturation protein HypF
MKNALIGVTIKITGIVQGVGFRPFVYGLANRLKLTGWVRNTSAGVVIQADGSASSLNTFLSLLESEAPPLAHIEQIQSEWTAPGGFTAFQIEASQPVPGAFQPISPDISVCPDCLRETFDPADRRYLYPFTNCTNCGPRFTIISDIPYDRPKTTMADFSMCQDCAAEYGDPSNRRFHAQPIACPVCGPQVWLEWEQKDTRGTDALALTQRLLQEGKIVAIKGIGGFHLACDASNPAAVDELRRRKLRVDKPFALMMADLDTVKSHCFLDLSEEGLLTSKERPIVLLDQRPESLVSRHVAPGQDTLGIMLPYTPLHHLLFSPQVAGGQPVAALVMTSGNLSEEPIASDNDEARQRLARLADAFLMHNRPIRTRCDDSVVRVAPGQTPKRSPKPDLASGPASTKVILPIRRSRGYAPFPVRLPFDCPSILAVGAELKNTFCITQQAYAFLSHHIGDLENFETLLSFEDGITHFERIFRFIPQAIAYDLHPDYLASRYAAGRSQSQSIPAFGIQHHHAHIAACMAENQILEGEEVIGVSFDGTGYGEDGAIWGGEFLIAGYKSYQRPCSLMNVPLPGGDKAIREPWRIALAWLDQADIPWEASLPPLQHVLQTLPEPKRQLEVLRRQLQSGLNAPPTSSMGRLFDAFAALAGVRQVVNYEAQAAIEFEAIMDQAEARAYPFELRPTPGVQNVQPWYNASQIDPTPALECLLDDLRSGTALSIISARFHNAIAQIVLVVCQRLRLQSGLNRVALSGGVWQNRQLLKKATRLLLADNFEVLTHHQVPANDGGLALGQAAIASQRIK